MTMRPTWSVTISSTRTTRTNLTTTSKCTTHSKCRGGKKMLDITNFETRKDILTEILGKNESYRRADMLMRHDLYRGKSKPYLEQRIRHEFNEESVKEMRLVPVNVLKKIVDAKSIVYKSPPVRKVVTENQIDQALVDYYAK